MLGDSMFPSSIESRSHQNRVYPLQSLFKIYSKLAFSNLTDRSIAISGLESRFTSSFGTKVSYGISERYPHRSILWQRPTAERMKRIGYPEDRKVPSWSWMACKGEIDYMDIPFGNVEWSDAVNWEPSKPAKLRGPVREFKNCTIELQDAKCDISAEGPDDERGWLKFDEEDIIGIHRLKCVIIGRAHEAQTEGQEHYVLAVTWQPVGEYYERVGVGSIQRRHISFEGRDFEGQIFDICVLMLRTRE